jgi:hypothetical protein
MDPILITIGVLYVLSKVKKQEAQIEAPAQTAPIADVVQRIVQMPTLATDKIIADPPISSLPDIPLEESRRRDEEESKRLEQMTYDAIFNKGADRSDAEHPDIQGAGKSYNAGYIIVEYLDNATQEDKTRIELKYGLKPFERFDEFNTIAYDYSISDWPNIYDLIRAVWGENRDIIRYAETDKIYHFD